MAAEAATKRGRPPVDNKATFRNVAVPLDAYDMLREMAGLEERTIARQLGVLIRKAHGETKSN